MISIRKRREVRIIKVSKFKKKSKKRKQILQSNLRKSRRIRETNLPILFRIILPGMMIFPNRNRI
jgi:hypothetical protein